ncbi:MAG: class II fructose-bisphosphate aldolase [Phycisphaerae bacterium]
MPLVSIKDELRKARAGRYAIPLFDVFDMAGAEGIIAALEAARAPAMIGIYGPRIDQPGGAALVAMVRELAAAAAVPVSLMLDHGASVEQCAKALSMGFTDVMYDGARLSVEENTANTRRVVEAARGRGACVEAELGIVGAGADYETFGGVGKGFTDPAVAARFVAESGCGCLAVAVGNAHGMPKGRARIDMDLLAEISRRARIPLAMHGGSGLSDEQYRQSIAAGIAKINIFTDLTAAAGEEMDKLFRAGKAGYFSVMAAIRDGFRSRAARYIDVFGAGQKAR